MVVKLCAKLRQLAGVWFLRQRVGGRLEDSMSLSICAVFKNEAPYLREWIEFHRIIGVGTFYLYENGSSDDWRLAVKPYIQEGAVKIVDWSRRDRVDWRDLGWQVAAYQHFIENHRKSPDWVAFIDCDEFLFSSLSKNVLDLLEQRPFSEYGAIGVNWMCFGAGGEALFRPEPVIQRFVLRSQAMDGINAHIKSIVRMDCALGATRSPHCFRVQGGTRGEHGEYLEGSFRFPPTHESFRINHYLTKSREEWDRRHLGGFRVDLLCDKGKGYFEDYQKDNVSDSGILLYLPELKRRLGLAGHDSS